ncbi:MAG TPA: carbon-nitrogen family hydrolase [Myxococcota bacterium]|nr:carbon-nitrogen family hydrolase [Myxococcota bacterium]HRY95878.1 carbon-nitrogen family hydrolase [Myxococcota bacterium]HSA22111.1 carbon-nitrogen family hydrolase [Myxococcota bacterium]
MKLAALQLEVAWEDRQANYARVEGFAARARAAGAELLVLPEMFATGFSLNPAFTAEADDGPTTAFLRALARRHGLAVLGGLVLAGAAGRGRNAARLVGPDGELQATYVKSHLFGYAGEDRQHEPGPGPVTFPLGGGRASAFVCYDLRFPELFRLVAEECWLMLVIASWPDTRQRAWDTLLPARAVENQCCLVGVNRVGQGGGLTYAGGSAIYGPLGEPLAAGGAQEGLLLAELEPARVAEVRARQPFLRDRRF